MIRALFSSPMRLALLGVLFLAGVTSARADGNLVFTLTATGDTTDSMTWTLPSSPTVLSGDSFTNSFDIRGVQVMVNGSPVTTDIFFFNQGCGSGCNDGGINDSTNLFNTFDYQTFSGTTANPTFIPGTYTPPAEDELIKEADADSWSLSNADNLTLTIATAPEPSSMLLLSIGLLGLMGIGLRRERLA
jgi:hypothetical protein